MKAAGIALICLPYAGGSAAAYAPLTRYLSPGIRACPVEYPGRGTRQHSGFYQSVEEAAADAACIAAGTDGPFALLGHSLGALIAYETVRLLEGRGGRMPVHLFVSGKQAPHIAKKEKEVHRLPDDEFKSEVMKLGGTPEEIFQHPELSAYYLPLLRADFRISELYRHQHDKPLNGLPVTVLGGDQDEITPMQLSGWKQHTTGPFRAMMLSGGHFFINHNFPAVAGIVNHALAEHL